MEPKRNARRRDLRAILLAVAALFAVATALTGCHRRHSYRPPALRHSAPFTDLVSIRSGNEVSVTWTMPEKTKYKFVRKGFEALHICRQELSAATCTEVGEPILLAAGASGSFSETLPKELNSGTPRILIYYIQASDRQALNRQALLRQSAPGSVLDEVATIAGNPPPALIGLTAQLQRGGVLLQWPSVTDTQKSEATFVRIYRRLRAKHPEGPTDRSPSPDQGEDVISTTRADSATVVDKAVRRNESYEYKAQFITQVKLKNRTLELAGELSAPVCIDYVPIPDVNLSAAEHSPASFAEDSCHSTK
jgi:hypothetical protein